jgi:aminopeptidase N
MNCRQFKAAHSDDLFRNLDAAAAEDNVLQEGLTVKQILDTWTLQKGHPLIRIGVTASIANQIYITQVR